MADLNPIEAEMQENREVVPGTFLMKLKPQVPVPRADPGQFFMVGLDQGHDPLLRRPLSLLYTEEPEDGTGVMEFLYEVRGKGTRALSRLSPPHAISLIGPLGRGFRLHPLPERVVMVAGGMGVIPLFAAVIFLNQCSPRPELEFIYGAKTAKDLVLMDQLEGMVSRTFLCTEDGCRGVKGFATRGLRLALEESKREETVILACGPRAMLKKTHEMARDRGIPCQVSMEARMACGMGACLTCSIKGADKKNLQVCRDGPVFDSEQVDWEALDESA